LGSWIEGNLTFSGKSSVKPQKGENVPMPIPIFQVDAFTDKPFSGNPAAVCILDGARDEEWMQQVAAEMNLSETAFLLERNAGEYHLRWFTPETEVDLCGHATLASAHVLWETGRVPEDGEIVFHIRSGILAAIWDGEWIRLDFPAVRPKPAMGCWDVLGALGLSDVFYVGKGKGVWLIETEDEADLRSMTPDFRRLTELLGEEGICVTCRPQDPAYDFICRTFFPGIGIDEDPVTGSVYCLLGPYWQEKTGKDRFLAFQASRRGGTVRVDVKGERVILAGQAVTVLRGELFG
jgi:PhzF family phenazine biosynthesis protein